MVSVIAITLFALTLLPLLFAGLGLVKNKKRAIALNLVAVVVLSFGLLTFGASAAAPDGEADQEAVTAARDASSGYGIGLMAAALATGVACIGAGIAVSASASAAIGALSEKPEIFGKALIFVALAEGIALYGMLISIQILSKL